MKFKILFFAKMMMKTLFQHEKVLVICSASIAIWSLNSAYSSMETEQPITPANPLPSRRLNTCQILSGSQQQISASIQKGICSKQVTQLKEKGQIKTEFTMLCLLILGTNLFFPTPFNYQHMNLKNVPSTRHFQKISHANTKLEIPIQTSEYR